MEQQSVTLFNVFPFVVDIDNLMKNVHNKKERTLQIVLVFDMMFVAPYIVEITTFPVSECFLEL